MLLGLLPTCQDFHQIKYKGLWVKRGRNPGNYKNAREVQNISSKLINQAKQIYCHNLRDKLSDPKIGQKSFWTAFKNIGNTQKQTNIPPIIENDIYIYIYIYMTFCKRLIYPMNILQLNVLSMAMVVYYLHTSPRQTNPFLISLSLKNKLLILFPSLM